MSTLFFYDSTFPFDGVRPSDSQLASLQDIANTDKLEKALASGNYQTLVHLHGSYFPKEHWHTILRFLKGGGGLVHLGDIPFRFPVYKENDEWKIEVEQTSYHQHLNIHEALQVKSTKVRELVSSADRPLLDGYEKAFSIQPTYGFVLHPTKQDDQPHENGSSGPMDAHIYPMLKGISEEGREISAPVVLIENTKGSFTGGRWIFINQQTDDLFWEHGAELLNEVASYTSEGVTEIWVKPGYASYYPGETPTLTIQLQSLAHIKGKQWTMQLHVLKDGSDEINYQEVVTFEESREWSNLRRTMPFQVEEGFYTIHVKAISSTGEVIHFNQGFWGFSETLLQEGTPLVAGRDYFEKGGKPFPIVGMTYMTSDVARKFLFMPNALVWDQDMDQMRQEIGRAHV